MDANDSIDLLDAPEIVFGTGDKALRFKVPELAAKQAAKVCDVVYDMMATFAQVAMAFEKGEPVQVRITEKDFTRMVDVVFYGITRNYPDWTRAKLDDAPIGLLDLVKANMTIGKQAGMFPEKAAPDPLPAGAATAAAPIGAESSPKSQSEQAGPSIM